MTIDIDHEGHTAIVTGGGRGIGRAISLAFAQAGANVVVAARTESELDETAASVEERGGKALAVRTDVTEPNDLDALVDRTVDRFD